MTLIKQYKLDPMKLGTNQIYDEINKIKENIKTLYDNGNNLTEISKILKIDVSFQYYYFYQCNFRYVFYIFL